MNEPNQMLHQSEYKCFHTDTMRFTRETKLDFCRCDASQHIKLSELLSLTSDTAIEDYYRRGLSWQMLREQGFAILASRVSFRIHRMPKANDELTVTTWEEAPQGLQLYRAYEVTTRDGERLVSGLSTWLVVNPDTRRILKPSAFTARACPTETTAHNCLECGKIAAAQNAEKWAERPVHFSDIDGNNHVNNARYGDFIVDSMPERFRARTVTDFRLNYALEATLGNSLTIFGAASDSDKKLTLCGKQNDSVCFEAEIFFA